MTGTKQIIEKMLAGLSTNYFLPQLVVVIYSYRNYPRNQTPGLNDRGAFELVCELEVAILVNEQLISEVKIQEKDKNKIYLT